MPGKITLHELKHYVFEGAIDTVIAAQIDMQGRLMGKRFHARHFVDSAWEETHSCNYLLATDMEMHTVEGYASTSWASGYGDYTMKPDMATLRLVPWLEGTALVLCDVLDHHTHAEVPHAPRSVLKRQIARLAEKDLTANAVSELEFFLFTDSYDDVRDMDYRGMRLISAYNEDYHIFQTTREEDVMRAIRNGLYAAGIPVENTKGEASAGQAELNIRYDEPLTSADNHSIAKHGCKEIAWQQGKSVTFMAKWNYDAAGSSCHVHQSLARISDGSPVFYDQTAPHGMSQTMKHYMAGLLHHAGAITCFLAPNINSYKRFQAGTFAPTKAVWSLDNRTAGYRVCGMDTKAVRVECRVGGADLNPYLAYAALLAAGLDGIEKQMELEPAFVGDAYGGEAVREIPTTLRAAADTLEKSAMMRNAFGDAVIDHYVRAARWEQEEYDRKVTDWEVQRGFERA